MHMRLLVLVLLAAPSIRSAQPQLPATPAARQFSAWLEAFNSGDRAALRQFFEKNFPSRVKDLDNEAGFREQTGGFAFKKAEESTATRFTCLVQERDSDQF